MFTRVTAHAWLNWVSSVVSRAFCYLKLGALDVAIVRYVKRVSGG